MRNNTTFPLLAIARAALSIPFALAGYDALSAPKPHRERIDVLLELAAPLGITRPSEKIIDTSTQATGALMLGAAAAFALPLRSKKARNLAALGGCSLAALQVPLTIANHPFWKANSADAHAQEMVSFASKLALGATALVLGVHNSRAES